MAKEYAYVEKPCPYGHEKKAQHIKSHSTLDAIVCYTNNANASDPEATIPHYVSHCFLKIKGEKQWRQYHAEGIRVDIEFNYKGQQIKESIEPNDGLYAVLHQLEFPNVRKRIEKKERIKEIDSEIKELRKEKRKLKKAV